MHGLSAGGIGAMHLLVRRLGLVDAIDENLSLLKLHRPYHESDHVLNIAFNVLAGNKRIEHLERLRNDEVYLDALGAERIPDPTTAGDFCRRFTQEDVDLLQDVFNATRGKVWRQQPAAFFDRAVIDADGTVCPTLGECKAGIEYSYKGEWGYHPLLVSLANTSEPLLICVIRSATLFAIDTSLESKEKEEGQPRCRVDGATNTFIGAFQENRKWRASAEHDAEAIDSQGNLSDVYAVATSAAIVRPSKRDHPAVDRSSC